MNLKSLVRKVVQFFQQGLKSYLRSFYSKEYYRDVAFREEGYGFKRLLLAFLVLMFISYSIISYHLIHQYETVYKARIQSLPNLQIEQGQLNNYNQSLFSERLVNSKYFLWINSSQLNELSNLENRDLIILSDTFLWIPYSGADYFAYSFSRVGNFIPLVSWKALNGVVNGQVIVDHINWLTILTMFFLVSILIYALNCLLIFIAIKLFGYIAKKMAVIVLREVIEYDLACRLLCLTSIPSFTIMALIIDIWGLNEFTKFNYMIVSMTYYYLSIRFIKEKSQVKWLNI
jgi:hypothetical protein